MPPQPLQYAHLTESNLKEHTKSFVDRIALQEQFILDYVLEQQIINNEKSQKSEKKHSLSSDSEKSKISSSGHSRYSIEHDLPSINGSLLISRNQLRKSKLSEIKESEPQNSKKIFSKKDRIGSTLLFEKLRDKPLKDKSLNIDHCNQKNRKSSKKEKNISKADRRKSCKRVDSLLASSQIMQQNWSSDKLGTNRVTLRSDNKAGLGIFNKGKASEKIKTKGVPDLVFSEIDFLNSNPSRKRRNQNKDNSGQKNGSRRKSDLQDKTRDTDETSSVHDSACCKDYSTSAKKKENPHSMKNLPEKRKKISNNKHYNKPNKSNQPRIIRVESKVASLSESFHDLLDEKSISSNNCSNASYSLANKKTGCSPEYNHVDKMSELQDEQNIISSHFIDEQKKESSKYTSSHSDIHSLSNNNGCTNSPESFQKRRSRKDKLVTSSYFASNNIKYNQTEREDNPFLNQSVESSPKPCSPVVDTNKQGIYQKDSKVEETAPKHEYESLSVQEKMTNDNMELDNDSKRLPVDESIKNFPNNRAIPSEENDNNLCNERMDIHFDPTWIKRKSLLSSQLQNQQNQKNQKISTSDNKITTYQSHRLSHAVIAEGAKIGQSCKLAKEDCGSINNTNTEFGNEIVKNDEKIRQEIFVENTNLEHMNVNFFNSENAIQSNCQEVISNVNNRFNMCHEDCNQIIFSDLNGFQDNNQSLYKSHYESSNDLTYGGIDDEFFAQEFAVDNQNFQGSNLYSTLDKNLPYENQHWIQSHIEQNLIPQTPSLIQNQFLWPTNNKSSNLINKELTQVPEVQNNKQSWEDRIDDYNTQYITAESLVCDHDDDPIEDETDNGIARFVWKKHRLH
ncbi:unnamed protein product [Rhizophagus irregularis]|nr:unnamed protein product [Rhizophagus irregularis]